jgi:hypothetical protein
MLEHIRSWSLRAKCRGTVNDDVFFPENRAKVEEGKKACTGCPVMGQCRLYAVVHDVPGIWGGTCHSERKKLIGPDALLILQELFLKEDLLEGSVKLLVEQQVAQFYPTVHQPSCADSI